MEAGLPKRLRVACKIELCAFGEAHTFIRGEMHQLPAYFDNPVEVDSGGHLPSHEAAR